MRAGANWISLRFPSTNVLKIRRRRHAGLRTTPLREESMTRFQRIALLTAACGVVALAIPYFIVVLLR
jgi:hypothetical protein